MINNPEWASKEEWDTYAWFGFAIQEVQSIERMLLEMAVALDIREGTSCSHEDRLLSLYDKLGRLTFGQLRCRVLKYSHFPEDLATDLKKAVNVRNDLAHAFFWPKDLGNNERTEQEAQAELMASASLFSNISPRLEIIMWSLFDNLGVDRSAAEDQAAILLGKK
ncbi:MAG: hypothetical protein K0B01_01935 [Syntrophobacterales bacterium]|nr:hypothetical protein [Syntrophobacterales bacterium]